MQKNTFLSIFPLAGIDASDRKMELPAYKSMHDDVRYLAGPKSNKGGRHPIRGKSVSESRAHASLFTDDVGSSSFIMDITGEDWPFLVLIIFGLIVIGIGIIYCLCR